MFQREDFPIPAPDLPRPLPVQGKKTFLFLLHVIEDDVLVILQEGLRGGEIGFQQGRLVPKENILNLPVDLVELRNVFRRKVPHVSSFVLFWLNQPSGPGQSPIRPVIIILRPSSSVIYDSTHNREGRFNG